jgi:DNA polymerase-3 subunit alpha
LVLAGAKKRWGDPLPEKYADRLSYELRVIKDMGFSSYFLIVWDLTRFAREQGIRVGPARGSAGGCAVAYCMGITEIDPIKYDLLFERFLNPSRISMPDIDMDFDTRYRDDMIRYAVEKYGKEHTAQIITFSSIKGRSAIKDAARVLDMPYALGDKISKSMPPMIAGRDTPLWACFDKDEKYADGYERAGEVRKIYESDPDAKKVIDVARGLEDLKRQEGIHAAAVVITPEPITDYLPIQRKPEKGKELEDATITTQYEMHGVEDLGLLKMDFLGLRNLDVIDITLKMIEEHEGLEIDMLDIPLDDEPTFQLLREGRSIGIFQLEGKQMRDLMRAVVPTEFDDIPAIISLYRPGPMAANMHNDYAARKNGRQPVSFDHPDIEEILRPTYGLMVYQEQLMRVAQRLGGYSLAEADLLRKACGKKNRELIAKERQKFIPAVVAQGYSKELAEQQFDIIEPFADYAFNKSHAVGYGLIAYQTAWLKANYPIYYMSALLTSAGTQDKMRVYLNECRHMGIEVLTPNVNVSYPQFRPVGQKIAFGLSSVRNLGEGWAEGVVTERKENGDFTSFQDFCERMPKGFLNTKFLESAIQGGAFDSIESHRKGMMGVMRDMIKAVTKRKKKEETGQMDMFAEAGIETETDTIKIPALEYGYLDRLLREKEMLGVFVSDNPLHAFEDKLEEMTDASIHDIVESEDAAPHTIGGLVTATKKLWTKKGEAMGKMVLEDLEGEVEVIVFPRTFKNFGHLVQDDAVLVVEGRYAAERREDANYIADKIIMVAGGAQEALDHYSIELPADTDSSTLDRLKAVLASHEGAAEVRLKIGDREMVLPDEFRVDPSLKLDVAVAGAIH